MFNNLPHNEPRLMDSTAVTTFMVCPRKYFYRMILGYDNPVRQPYFAFGSAYHLFRHVIEVEYLKEPDITKLGNHVIKGIEAASAYCDKNLIHTDTNPKYKWGWMTKDRLIKSCIAGANWWKAEKQKGAIKVLAMEQPFQIELSNGRIIAGRADQVVNFNGKVWGRDFKTSSSQGNYYINSLNPNHQFSLYTYAENKLAGWDDNDINDRLKVEGQLIEVLYNNKTQGPKIEVYLAQRTRNELLTWLKEEQYWHSMIEGCKESDTWPMNPKSCTFCEYRKVCELSNETQQMTYLKNNYKFKPWDCTATDINDAEGGV